MTSFNQSNQKVSGNQYNAGEDINIGSVQNTESLAKVLNMILVEISHLTEAGKLNKKISKEVEDKVKKVVAQSQNATPDKKSTASLLTEAKSLIEGISSATTLITLLSQATEAVKRLF